jgi:hypothetical protein
VRQQQLVSKAEQSAMRHIVCAGGSIGMHGSKHSMHNACNAVPVVHVLGALHDTQKGKPFSCNCGSW